MTSRHTIDRIAVLVNSTLTTPRPSATRRLVFRLLRVGAVIALLMVGALMLFEEKIIFPAPRYPTGNWRPQGFVYEDAYFASEDGTRLHGWYFPHSKPRGHLLYCHGNGDCVAYLGEYAEQLRQRFELAVFVFDYRGYGRSEGRPEENGVMRDARAAQLWLADRAKKNPDELILMGRSLGGAVVIGLAAKHGGRALVLQNTFTSMVDVAAVHFPWFPVRQLMRTRFNSLEEIGRYHGPVLQSHGTADEVVPFELGQRLFAAIPGPKQFIACPGMGHNSFEPEVYNAALNSFLASVCD